MTWRDMKRYRTNAQQHREQHLDDMIRQSQLEDNESREKAIRGIKNAEKNARQQMRINRVAGKLKRGVRTVYVPSDTTKGEWEMKSTKEEIEETIITQNCNHLQKAGETPFAHGEYYERLNDKTTREQAMTKILKGETEWAHPMDKVDGWLEHLTYQYDKEHLEEESRKLGDKLSYEEYHRHFKKTERKHGVVKVRPPHELLQGRTG